MPHTLSSISTARAQRALRLAQLERKVQEARETIFGLVDTANACVPNDHTQLHVSLQVVANELGHVEQLLSEACSSAPSARAS